MKVSREVAILAKSKGFNFPCRQFYADLSWSSEEVYSCLEVGYGEFTSSMENDHGFGDITLIPSQSLLQSWLRDVRRIHLGIEPATFVGHVCYYNMYVIDEKNAWDNAPKVTANSYEECLELFLHEALKTE